MNHEELMAYAVKIMVPVQIREYFLQDDWEKTIISEEKGNAFIEYSQKLREVISTENPKTFRDFLDWNSYWHGEELKDFLELNNETLSTLANLIKIEQSSKSLEGNC